MQAVTFEAALEQILAADPRYPRDAYLFVREALDYTQHLADKENRRNAKRAGSRPPAENHVTARQLLEGVRQFVLSPLGFGPMTITVFQDWGITDCRDFGNLVFNMVEAGLLKKTETDSRADFQDGYSFEEAFRNPFLPARKRSGVPAEADPAAA